MVRQTPYHDLDADELATDHFPAPSPRMKTRNGGTARESASSKEIQPKSPLLSKPANGDPPVSNSSRKRAAPASKEPTKKRAKSEVSKPKKPKRIKEDVFNEPKKLIGSRNSLLYTSKISIPAILTNQETRQILATMDMGNWIDELEYGDFRDACTRFREEGQLGFHEDAWLASALEASERRANGDFDDMVDVIFRERWAAESGSEYSDSEDENEGVVDAGKNIEEKTNGTVEKATAEGANGQVEEGVVDAGKNIDEKANGTVEEAVNDAGKNIDEKANGTVEEATVEEGVVDAGKNIDEKVNGTVEEATAESANGQVEEGTSHIEQTNSEDLETNGGVEVNNVVKEKNSEVEAATVNEDDDSQEA